MKASVVIPAHNEEKNIGAKLNEILNLDYPKEKMEIVVSPVMTQLNPQQANGLLSVNIQL